MKSLLLSLLIALSLGVNALVIVGLSSPATLAPLVALVRSGPAPVASDPSTRAASPRPGTSSGRPDTDRTGAKWADLQSDDPDSLVANLRAAGFSDPEIRGILATQLNQKVQARRRELAGPAVAIPWWRNPIGSTNPLATNPRAQAELRAMSKANANLLDSLLGPAPAGSQPNPLERLQYADLPADKIEQLKLITSDYSDQISAVQSSGLGAMFPEDRAILKLLNEEKDKDIRALLTPDEYENYQLRSSNTAQSMRNNLQLFQPTEDEFRRIFALQYAFDQQYNTSLGIDNDLMRQRSLAQTELTAQIRAALPPDRVADYDKATDSSYRQAAALVSRLELPNENATQLWQMQKDTQQRLSAVRTDRSLSVEARNQALATLQQEVTARATGVLGGPRGFDAYKQNGGQWIQNIVPPAASGSVPQVIGSGTTTIIINSDGSVTRF